MFHLKKWSHGLTPFPNWSKTLSVFQAVCTRLLRFNAEIGKNGHFFFQQCFVDFSVDLAVTDNQCFQMYVYLILPRQSYCLSVPEF